jgi:hypothetical protein
MDGDRTASLGSVEAALNYMIPMAEKPRSYTYDPPPGVPVRNSKYEERRLAIRDGRPLLRELSLDRHGFKLLRQETNVADLYDEAALKAIYYPEMERLVAAATGATRVVVFDHTLRNGKNASRDAISRDENGVREPVKRVHNDYTVKSGPQRVRDLFNGEAEELLKHRFAVINVWRPIKGPVETSPLAVCDARSIAFADLVAQDLIYQDRIGETYAITFNPAHRWFYFPRMRTDEVLLIKCYDSKDDGRARFAAHTAFDDPTTPPNAAPRESIEIRTLAFFPPEADGARL